MRISKLGDREEPVDELPPGLPRVVIVAARLADAKGDDAAALAALESGIERYADALPAERARAVAYRAELAVRLDRPDLARSSLDELATLDLSDDERAELAPEIVHVEALLDPAGVDGDR